MTKTYVYCLVIIGVYLIVISPLNKKEEKKEDSKKEEKKDNSNSNEPGTNKTPLQRRFPNFNTSNRDVNGDGKINMQDEVDKISTNTYTI